MKSNGLIKLFMLLGFIVSGFFMAKFISAQKRSLESLMVSKQEIGKAFGDYVLTSSASVSIKNHTLVNERFDTVPGINGLFMNGRYKLGIYLSDRQCVECQMDALTYLNLFSDSIGVENTIIFSNYHNMNELSVLKERAKTKTEVLNAMRNFFSDNISNANTPFFFLVDSSLTVSSLFMHNKSVPAATEFYLGSVKLLVGSGS
ncbi:hypothetical protein [Chitinophaga sp. XS-30]|uniref:hypothetical protein n=1 Tax=Chitinophaga sp. XS-30 TaxID=2604421 RepID=UPI0011DDC80C|nr:hypothetical protein [Chitinophaga sp. XS-30]QEH39721.1 hypothetical protein FW415_02120 [Chitinophaga sp. XS-30]